MFLPLGPTQQPSHVPTIDLQNPPSDGSEGRSVCMLANGSVWGRAGAGASSRVYFCHNPPPHLCGPVTRDAEGCVFVACVYVCMDRKGTPNWTGMHQGNTTTLLTSVLLNSGHKKDRLHRPITGKVTTG